jgi:hypothetical protein
MDTSALPEGVQVEENPGHFFAKQAQDREVTHVADAFAGRSLPLVKPTSSRKLRNS